MKRKIKEDEEDLKQMHDYSLIGFGLLSEIGGCVSFGYGLHHFLKEFPQLNADARSTIFPGIAGLVFLYIGQMVLQEVERQRERKQQLEQIIGRELTPAEYRKYLE